MEEKKEEKKKEEKEKCKNSTRTRWWSRIGKSFVGASTRKRKEEGEEKKCRSKVRYSKARQGLGRRLLPFCLLEQSMFCVNAAAEGSQNGSECEEKCSSKRKGKRNLFLTDGSSQKDRCTLLSGSAST